MSHLVLWLPGLISVLSVTGVQDGHAAIQPKIDLHALEPHEQVRVRLERAWVEGKVQGANLEVRAAARTRQEERTPVGVVRVSERVNGYTPSVVLRCEAGVIRIRGPFQERAVKSPVRVTSPAGFLLLEGKIIRDSLIFYSGARGCEVINHLSLEKYLEGVVNAEFDSTWNVESVAAQVVAARSYALYRMRAGQRGSSGPRKRQASHYDLERTPEDQAYGGFEREDFRAARVVAMTRGLVLEDAKTAKPVPAFYHSSCGGRTLLPEKVWGEKSPGFLKSVQCPYCVGAPSSAWRLTLPMEEIQGALRPYLGRWAISGTSSDGTGVGYFQFNLFNKLPRWNDLAIDAIGLRPEKGDARDSVIVTMPGAGNIALPASEFRRILGPSRLKSTHFEAWRDRDAFVFRGRGNGHGVGLCQWGAKGMGDRGYRMKEILEYYYTGSRVAKLW